MPDRPQKRANTDAYSAALRSQERPITPQEERRSVARFPCTVTAEVFELQSHARLMGRTTDLGIGGCYVASISPFPVGTRVRLQLTDQARHFEVHGQVVFAQMGMGMGLAFTEVSAEQLEVLRLWIDELSGELPPSASPPMPTLQDYAAQPAPLVEQSPPRTERLVLTELISLLMRKHVLTEAEGTALLRELYR
jgi:hypothetical protein